jgi:hypothetical protein
VEALKAKAAHRGFPFFAISSVTGQGLDELRFAVGDQLFAPAAPVV